MSLYLNALGLCCSLGIGKSEISDALFSADVTPQTLRRFLKFDDKLLNEGNCYLGHVTGNLAQISEKYSEYKSRNNQLLLTALLEIKDEIQSAINNYGPDRIAVIIGTSTSGIAEGEKAFAHAAGTKEFPENFSLGIQEMSDGAEFLADYLGLSNIVTTISTACSSSAKVFSHAQELIDAGICDAAIVGGADSLCKLTVNGFHSLGALSEEPCNPFSKSRSGISIGEGAALFLMSKDPSDIEIMSVGESSDGYSMTAPQPDGFGAESAMRDALQKSGINEDDIAYLNLHGTATHHNDSMEAKAVMRVFGADVPCSSTKAMTGHTLGAAGAVETALCWLMLSKDFNPVQTVLPHVWDNVPGPDIELNGFCIAGQILKQSGEKPVYVLSNSFAFGGSNTSVLLKTGSSHD